MCTGPIVPSSRPLTSAHKSCIYKREIRLVISLKLHVETGAFGACCVTEGNPTHQCVLFSPQVLVLTHTHFLGSLPIRQDVAEEKVEVSEPRLFLAAARTV